MKKTILKVVYYNAGIAERFDTTLETKGFTTAATLLGSWDAEIPKHDLRSIEARLEWMLSRLSSASYRFMTQSLRTPSGFTAKITVTVHDVLSPEFYQQIPLDRLVMAVNARLVNQHERGGLILLKGTTHSSTGEFRGTIYEHPESFEPDPDHMVPRDRKWTAEPGVLLRFTTEGKYAVVYEQALYDAQTKRSDPIATLVVSVPKS